MLKIFKCAIQYPNEWRVGLLNKELFRLLLKTLRNVIRGKTTLSDDFHLISWKDLWKLFWKLHFASAIKLVFIREVLIIIFFAKFHYKTKKVRVQKSPNKWIIRMAFFKRIYYFFMGTCS
jgi:hypothetical protein